MCIGGMGVLYQGARASDQRGGDDAQARRRHAACRSPQVEGAVAARCVSAALAAGRAGAWSASLGALRLARVLGAFKGAAGTGTAGELEALRGVREAAAAAKGPGAARARLLAGQIDRLAAAAAGGGGGARR